MGNENSKVPEIKPFTISEKAISDESPLFAIIRDFTWDKFYVVGLPLEHSALNTICETIQKFIVPTKNKNTKNKRNKNTKKPIIQQIHPESKEHYVHKIKASFGEGLVEGTTSVDTDGDFMGELVVRLVWTSLLVNLHKSGYKLATSTNCQRYYDVSNFQVFEKTKEISPISLCAISMEASHKLQT